MLGLTKFFRNVFWTRQIKLLQYSQRHSMINHCDKRITHLSDTGIYLLVCLIYLLILICLFGDSKQHSKCKRIFNDVFNRAKDISKSPRWVICRITEIYHAMSLTVLYKYHWLTKETLDYMDSSLQKFR
jgi:hypothetical protein